MVLPGLEKSRPYMVWNNSFVLLLISQGISSLGDSLRFIAISALIFNITGSGLSVGVGLFFSVIPNLLLSLIAGSIGDILPGKFFLGMIELLRSGTIILFINNGNIMSIYMLMMILSSLDSVYNPPLRKVMVNILGRNEILSGNSVLNGMLGISSIAGSALAGVLTGFWGLQSIFLINACLHVVSAVIIMFIILRKPSFKSRIHEKTNSTSSHLNVRSGIKYLQSCKEVKELLYANAVVCLGTISVNMAFYPFAFDTLRVTVKEWSLMMSIFYGSSLLAMLISLFANKKMKQPSISLIYLSALLACVIWSLYGITESLPVVLFIQLIEGTSLSLFGIFLTSRLQLAVNKGFIARVTGINDFITAIAKTFGIACTYMVLSSFSYKSVFIINSIFLFAYTIYRITVNKVR